MGTQQLDALNSNAAQLRGWAFVKEIREDHYKVTWNGETVYGGSYQDVWQFLDRNGGWHRKAV